MRGRLRVTGIIGILLGVLLLVAAAVVALLGYPNIWFLWDGVTQEDKWPWMRVLVFTGLLGLLLLFYGILLWRTGNAGRVGNKQIEFPKKQFLILHDDSQPRKVVLGTPHLVDKSEDGPLALPDYLGLIVGTVGAVFILAGLILFAILYPEAWYPANNDFSQNWLLRLTSGLDLFGILLMVVAILVTTRRDRQILRSLRHGHIEG